MPSASGVYSLPSGYLAVSGKPILPSQHNPPLEDIAAALTNRLSRDGSAAMTAGLKGVAGSAALPGYAFSTDATTGYYLTTNGLGITVRGVQVAEFTAAGMASGVWIPGMIIPWTMQNVPNVNWVFPVGQTLSRTTYSALWARAQAEIAAGNTFFNNGDGSTTFGIGDLRGRTIAAVDNMGGSDAARLAQGVFASGGLRGTLGAAAGESAHTLSTTELPAIIGSTTATSAQAQFTYDTTSHSNGSAGGFNAVGPGQITTSGGSGLVTTQPFTLPSVTVTNASGGQFHNNIQPTMLCNYIMFAGGTS